MKKASLLNKIKKWFIRLLPAVLFFSYYPLFSFGSNSDTNFELSLPLIWLLSFSLLSIPSAIRFIKNRSKVNKKQIIISLLFPIYSTITIIWSLNPLRAFLTTGVMWCIWLSIISIIDYYQSLKEKEKQRKELLKIFFISTLLVCVFCWVQCVLDVINISRNETLLCPGCTNYSFGFPHPNGFAIEPQFMGNLLLAPIFVSLYLFLNAKEKRERTLFCITSLFISSTLFLTMSRGAIYAFAVGVIPLLILEIKKKKTPRPFIIIPILITSFFLTLVFQGVLAEVSPTNDTFSSGASKVVNQLSLGIVDIPYELKTIESEDNLDYSGSSQFDGYAEVSTTTRLGFSELALKTWSSSPINFIFGVGTGASGKAMHNFAPETSAEKEIVQNETLEIALEQGLIGIIILMISLVKLVILTLKLNHKNLIIPIIISFFISYQFFSGLPNALHIFLLPALMMVNMKKSR